MRPNRPRLFLTIVLLALLSLPLIVMAVVKVIFNANALRPEQFHTPSFISLKLGPKPAGAWPNSPKSFDEFLASTRDEEAAALYRACFSSARNPGWLVDSYKSNTGSVPPAAEQWLRDNQELIKSLMRCSKIGLPMMTCEQAAGYGTNMPSAGVPNYLALQESARILVMESRRLRFAGKPDEAADALIAIGKLANSIREPFLINALISAAMHNMAAAELGRWLGSSNPPSPEVARRLREQLEIDVSCTGQYRRNLELEFYCQRTGLIELLDKPYFETGKQIVKQKMSTFSGQFPVPGQTRGVGWVSRVYFESYAEAFKLKASACTILDEFDRTWAEALTHPNRVPRKDDSRLRKLLPYMFLSDNFYECCTRFDVTHSRAMLDLEALDRIIDPAKKTVRMDPFTSVALRMTDETTTTLIYSVGPDLIDQRGMVEYDPINGTMSAGDIMIRLPHRER